MDIYHLWGVLDFKEFAGQVDGINTTEHSTNKVKQWGVLFVVAVYELVELVAGVRATAIIH